jgi:hypothetical protein
MRPKVEPEPEEVSAAGLVGVVLVCGATVQDDVVVEQL